MQILSAFGGGLFLIPLLILLAAAYSFYRGIKASKSGSTIQDKYGTASSDKNVSFFQTGGGIFSIILFAALILVIILMLKDR